MSVHASLKSLPEWNRLVELVRELAFLDGGSDDAFTLASGRQSRWFFDMKPVMMHTESSKLLAHLFNHRLDDLNPDFVGGLELGAFRSRRLLSRVLNRIIAKGSWFANRRKDEAVARPTIRPESRGPPLQVAVVSSFSRMSPPPEGSHPSR